MILIFGLYKYQVKIVEITTIIMPGESNVQINVPLLLMTAFNKIEWNLREEISEQRK